MLSSLLRLYEKNRRWLDRIPLINRFPTALRRRQRRQSIASKENTKDVFTHIYTNNLWNAESRSGPGSTEEGTSALRRELPLLVKEWNIQSIFDAPCGDYYWFPKIIFDRPLRYIGGDIVDDLVANNQRKHGSENVTFRALDIIREDLPDADLWLCRDCWIHFSEEDIFKTVRNFLRSNIQYLLVTTYPDCRENLPILTGEFRPINLTIAPFFFPAPLLEINDPLNKYPNKKMGLWKREQLAAVIPPR